MRQILEDFMAMLVANEEEDPKFTNKEMLLFYSLIGFIIVVLAFLGAQ